MDIAATGRLRPAPNGFEAGKYFAESAGDATKWGTALEGVGGFRIVEVVFTAAAAARFMRYARLDGIGPARYALFEEMEIVSVRLWSADP